jgi:uncharacterized RDD family membrane protein YckC
VGAATEGALAPDPAAVTPPPRRPDGERILEIPALRRREPTWKDEVRERMKHRRHRRGEPAPLPLFDSAEAAPAPREPEADEEPGEAPPRDVLDLPLRAVEAPAASDEEGVARLALDPPVEAPWPEPPADGIEPSPPLERPATFAERAEAAAIDLLVLGAVWSAVVYFAGRAARAELAQLLPAWPYLAGFLAFLGLAYAAAFTGLRGQTLGKMMLGLRVVDGSGRSPGPSRAALRVAAAVVGIAALGLGAFAILLDPARRALHDRLLKTRVVRV